MEAAAAGRPAGPALLFFGCRSKAADCFFAEDWEARTAAHNRGGGTPNRNPVPEVLPPVSALALAMILFFFVCFHPQELSREGEGGPLDPARGGGVEFAFSRDQAQKVPRG